MRNLNKPPRYNVASVQAQQTLGGDVMQSHEQGDYVEFRDYQWLLTEKQRLDVEVEFWKSASTDNGIACNERANENQGLENENARLKAEVDRLTKAGDELHAFLINYIVESRISSAYLNKLDDEWNAAKGVQS
jgi:hypothetical protein